MAQDSKKRQKATQRKAAKRKQKQINFFDDEMDEENEAEE